MIGGCVSQVGEQSFNIARVAWLSAGLPLEVASTTVDSQCGSSQQATSIGAAMVGAGLEDIVMSCGVEMMTRVPLGSNMKGGVPMGPSYMSHYQPTSQFMGAAMIAEEYQITREDTDAFGLRSQQRAIAAWEAGHFAREVAPITAPTLDKEGKPTGAMHTVCARRRSARNDDGSAARARTDAGPEHSHRGQQLAGVRRRRRGDPRVGKSRQVDGAQAARAHRRHYAVGVDPVTMLKGPIPATTKVLAQAGLKIDDIDTFEVNEAFASVVLAWQRVHKPDPDRVNPNGGAIAIGHPTGSTGARLITTALHTLERTNGRYGLISMCCGGGLGTGTIIERL